MEYLDEQEEFEQMIGRGAEVDPTSKAIVSGSVVIYFGANWCGPCKRVAPKVAELMAQNPQIKWLKCDVDRNNYTPTYCQVKSIPAFMAIKDKKILGQAQLSDGDKLAEWVRQMFSNPVTS